MDYTHMEEAPGASKDDAHEEEGTVFMMDWGYGRLGMASGMVDGVWIVVDCRRRIVQGVNLRDERDMVN